MTDDDLTDIQTLVRRAVAATTIDAEDVIRRARVSVRRRRRRVRLASAGVVVLAAGGLAAGIGSMGHGTGRAQVVVVGTPTPTPTTTAHQPLVPPPAVLEHVDLPVGWTLLNEQTYPLPTPDGSRVTDREVRYVGPAGTTGGEPEVIVVLQTGHVAGALDAQRTADPGSRTAPITRPGASPIQFEPATVEGAWEQYSWLEDGVFVQVAGRGGIALAPIASSLKFRPGPTPPYLVTAPTPNSSTDGTTPAPPASRTLGADGDQLAAARGKAFGLSSRLVAKVTRMLNYDAIDVLYSGPSGDVEVDTQTLDAPIPLQAAIDMTAPHAYVTDPDGDSAAVSLSAGRLEVAVADAYGHLILVQGTASLLGSPNTVLRQAETYLSSAPSKPISGLPTTVTLSP